ncbi:MAG: NAD(P)H-dependent oxidoreductase subunit E [Myxococcota bacterium]|nr:NAD(P)H-dependent oxidoreductase subunit E [Myxococcota bacterium]
MSASIGCGEQAGTPTSGEEVAPAVDLAPTDAILAAYPRERRSALMILQDVQQAYRYLPRAALERVAEVLGVPRSHVYSLAAFYRAFSLVPRGRHTCTVCVGTACHVRGAALLVERVERRAGIKAGETTPDRQLTLETVNCVGACALGPLAIIDGEYHGNMTPTRLDRALADLRKDKDQGREAVPADLPNCRGGPGGGEARSAEQPPGAADGGHADYMYLEIEKEAKRPDGSAGGPVVTTTMMIRFPGTAVDMDFTKNVVYRAECLIGARELSDCLDIDRWPGAEELPAEARTVLRPREYHPEARGDVGGGFRTRVAEAGAILDDVRASAAGALIGMMLVVLAAFRSFRALLYVMLPLVFGIVMCLGIAYLLLERLNLITAFTFAVLLGLGIDFGIHIGKRYEEERAGGLGNEDAIARAFRQTGKAILVAMVTTVLAFAALITARFRGFSEFGELCAIGIPLSMLAAFGLFPAVVTLAERVRPLRVRPRRDVPRSAWRIPRAVGRVVLVLAALGTAAAASAAPLVGFEYDYGKLGTKRPVSSRIDARAATRGYTGSPAVAMAETPRQAEAAHRYIRRRMLAGEHLLRAAFSLYSFVPDQQARKLRTLREIDTLMEDPSFGFFEDRLDDEDLDRLDEWRRYLRIGGVEPLSPDFPAWARGLFTELDGSSVGRVLYLMPKVDTSDGFQARRLQDAYQTIRLPDGSKVPVASSGFVFADVIRYIREDGTLATSLAFAVVFAVLFVQTRSLPRTLTMLVSLLAGFAWLFGTLAALDINLTFYSVVMLPVILGVGIDGSVHLYSRYVEDGPGSMPRVLLRTGPAVLVSALTTAVSFGSLMATQHRGLFSMGQIAVIGMGAVTLATFVVLPAMLIAFERRPVGEGEGREPGA